MLDITKLTHLSYLMQARPTDKSTLVQVIAILFATSLVASPIIWLVGSRAGRANPPIGAVGSRLSRSMFTIGLVGLILIFFRWQGIPYFASRVWLLGWLVIGFWWLVRFVVYLLKKFPRERRLFEEERRYQRYLPKKKY